MQDGQALSVFHPNRAEEDAEDLELVAKSDSETEARTASFGIGLKHSGESDSSIKHFMADWSSDFDAPGDYGAESEPIAQTVAEGKRPRTDDDVAGSSKAPKKRGGPPPKRPAPVPTASKPSGPVLTAIPLNIARPTFSMANFASHLPRADGYFSLLLPCFNLVRTFLLTCFLSYRDVRSLSPMAPGATPIAPPTAPSTVPPTASST